MSASGRLLDRVTFDRTVTVGGFTIDTTMLARSLALPTPPTDEEREAWEVLAAERGIDPRQYVGSAEYRRDACVRCVQVGVLRRLADATAPEPLHLSANVVESSVRVDMAHRSELVGAVTDALRELIARSLPIDPSLAIDAQAEAHTERLVDVVPSISIVELVAVVAAILYDDEKTHEERAADVVIAHAKGKKR